MLHQVVPYLISSLILVHPIFIWLVLKDRSSQTMYYQIPVRPHIPSHIHDFTLLTYALSKSTYKSMVAFFAAASFRETIVEIRSTRSFNAIPRTVIRDVF